MVTSRTTSAMLKTFCSTLTVAIFLNAFLQPVFGISINLTNRQDGGSVTLEFQKVSCSSDYATFAELIAFAGVGPDFTVEDAIIDTTAIFVQSAGDLLQTSTVVEIQATVASINPVFYAIRNEAYVGDTLGGWINSVKTNGAAVEAIAQQIFQALQGYDAIECCMNAVDGTGTIMFTMLITLGWNGAYYVFMSSGEMFDKLNECFPG